MGRAVIKWHLLFIDKSVVHLICLGGVLCRVGVGLSGFRCEQNAVSWIFAGLHCKVAELFLSDS